MKVTSIIIVVLFSFIWSWLTRNLLPSNISDVKGRKSKRYDEREKIMFAEVFAKSFVGIIYFVLFALLLRIIGISEDSRNLFLKFPEATIIVVALLLLVVNYFLVKRKYTVRD
ncbi:membrane protein [Staphylococcus piscifermentans]|uniref:Uncharacterized protein n=1 Tax=Staphylococcus piscifermentans TaxID=70258 RepID=A0A239TGB2_9STAP|nr:hypothetical protein [Staphylococcus piscifermentans]RTX85387.1 hypothetical protein CD139_03975 [Staphylococcus piscifermentans]GEP83593.1 hypothetical protein SPI02_01780 [Staphylococcus piscifermentans]SNU96602.1 membrane protein [Staphylococcus piscifermentans]